MSNSLVCLWKALGLSHLCCEKSKNEESPAIMPCKERDSFILKHLRREVLAEIWLSSYTTIMPSKGSRPQPFLSPVEPIIYGSSLLLDRNLDLPSLNFHPLQIPKLCATSSRMNSSFFNVSILIIPL